MVFVIRILLHKSKMTENILSYVATLTPPYKVTFVLLISFLKYRLVTTIIRLPYHVHMVEWDNAQHIYCSPHPVQFLWDTDSLVRTLVHKELDVGSCMLLDTLFHILCTLDPQWDNLFLLIYINVAMVIIFIVLLFDGTSVANN